MKNKAFFVVAQAFIFPAVVSRGAPAPGHLLYQHSVATKRGLCSHTQAWLLAHTEMICLQCGRPKFNPWVGKIPWRREWLPTPLFWSGEFHGLHSPWGRKVRHDWVTFTKLKDSQIDKDWKLKIRSVDENVEKEEVILCTYRSCIQPVCRAV